MVVVEKTINQGINKVSNGLFNLTRILAFGKSSTKEVNMLSDLGLYNIEQFSNSNSRIDLGIELYDIESSWK